MTGPVVRAAIYTRKSSEEGLEQEFNSLEAQHEACAAYIASQRHEGWKLLPARYDDGGISGGTLDRPGLQHLLADIDAGRVDMVVVYKIDRLTRSLADFAKLVERLETANCSFVSVTQAFNTSSSMGRLTLNVLLSFAQFEREVTAERIRDKIAASKKKGLWMGGLPPLGYDPHPDKTRRELVVTELEAETVRALFTLYLEHGCLNATAKAAEERGLRSKRRHFVDGRMSGDAPFSRGQIHRILTNPVYRGLIRHKEKTWPGMHPAVVDEDLWNAAQAKLQSASARRRGGSRAPGQEIGLPSSAPLLGKIRDETGDLLTPTHSQRHGRRHPYYVSNRLVMGKADPRAWRLPARGFEEAVVTTIADHFETFARRHAVLRTGSAASMAEAAECLRDLVSEVRELGIRRAAPIIAQGVLRSGHLRLVLSPAHLAKELGCHHDELDPAIFDLKAPLTCRRRGVEMKIIAGERYPAPDRAMLRALRNAHLWADKLRSGATVHDIAEAASVSESYMARVIPLAMLSPRIKEAIVAGSQPLALNLEALVRTKLPLDWAAQERLLGFAS